MIEVLFGDIWIAPGFKLTTPDNNKRNIKKLR